MNAEPMEGVLVDFKDNPQQGRFEQAFDGGRVWADYAVQGDVRAILHVEADPGLRGSGAAGTFLQEIADHARSEGIKLIPRCSYAVAWFKRHPDQGDVLA